MENKQRPNIIIINPDQMRADALAHLGNPASYTPHMDALAREGVSFENCFCQNPVCTPSRCSFMTGNYPHTHGHRTMRYLLRRGEDNLFTELKRAGYRTWANARGDLIAGQDKKWTDENFDVLCEELGEDAGQDEGRGERGSDRWFSFYRGIITPAQGDVAVDIDMSATLAAADYIRSYDKEQPLLLFLGFVNPHPPYRVEEKYLRQIDKKKLKTRTPTLDGSEGKSSMAYGLLQGWGVSQWSDDRFDDLRATYLGMCARADDMTGMVIQALKDADMYDNSAIFVLSDHGDYTGDYGLVEKAQNTFEDCLTNIPLLIKPPRGAAVDPGINPNLVEAVDFYATAMDYAGVPMGRTQFGKSLRQTVADKTVSVRDAVFCEGGRLAGESQCMELPAGPIDKMIGDEYEPRLRLQRSENGEHTKATMIRTDKYKYVRRFYEEDEFYVLDSREGESLNRIHDPAYAGIILELKEKMLSWYQETCDTVPWDADSRMNDGVMIRRLAQTGIPEEYLKKKVFEEGVPLNDLIIQMMAARGK